MTPLIFVNDNVPLGARGMERYFRHVTQAICADFQEAAVVFSPRTENYAPARSIQPWRFKGSEQFRLHEFQARRTLHTLRPQLIFSGWFAHFATTAPQVFVVYDLIYEKFPQHHARWQTPLRNLARERRLALERADHLIVISHSTARDLLQLYPQVDPERLSVIPLGVDDAFFGAAPADAAVTSAESTTTSARPYFLFVGFRSGHKNFGRLLDAFTQSGLHAVMDLRVISALPFTAEEEQQIRRSGAEAAVIWMGSQRDDALRAAYRHALAFIYPSEYEGFGLPILEAFAAGALVATANVSSMPEVGGDVAFYFDPLDTASLATCLQTLAALPDAARTARIAQGQARARDFSWRRCEAQTVQLLRSLIENGEAA